MAGIDKIYGSQDQWSELVSFLIEKNKYSFLNRIYLYPMYRDSIEDISIANFSTRQDYWLIRNCPLKWVQRRLEVQYGNLYKRIKKNSSLKQFSTDKKFLNRR